MSALLTDMGKKQLKSLVLGLNYKKDKNKGNSESTWFLSKPA